MQRLAELGAVLVGSELAEQLIRESLTLAGKEIGTALPRPTEDLSSLSFEVRQALTLGASLGLPSEALPYLRSTALTMAKVGRVDDALWLAA